MEDQQQLGGVLGGGPAKYNLRMAEKALRDDYPISPDMRQLIINQAVMIAGTAKNKRTRLAACKVLLAADGLNIKRKAVNVQERQADVLESTAAVREAMRVPAIREAMALLSDKICAPPKVIDEPQAPTPKVIDEPQAPTPQAAAMPPLPIVDPHSPFSTNGTQH